MMAQYPQNGGYDRDVRTGVDAARLWAGGVATAVVAALVAIVGLLIARGIFAVPVLAPKGEGIWGNASTTTYAIAAAVAALLATGLMHLLSVATPAPGQFFGWIMVLVTLIAVVLPLTLTVEPSAKIATAVINLVIGLVIAIVVNSMAANARTLHHRKRRETRAADAPTRQWNEPPQPPSSYYDR
ncbi:MAG TPA: DUF6069 family protein [Amycolatopsis sp.]|jgi:hypothetical protein